MPKLITLFAVIALLICLLSLFSQSRFSLSLDVDSAAPYLAADGYDGRNTN